jgi:hypothetical protein
MILRWVPFRRIRYILGATGDGSQSLRSNPDVPLSQFETIWIQSGESLRAWLLSNPVLQDPLDLLIYGYRDEGDAVPDSPELRGRAYLDEDWVEDLGAYDAPVGQIHVRVRAPRDGANDRARDGQNDEKAQQGDKRLVQRRHPEMMTISSPEGWEVNDSGDDDKINTRKSRAAEPAQSPQQLLRIKTWFQNKELSGLILPAPAQKDGWMGGASFDTKNVLGVKPNLNIQRLPDLLPLPPC